MASSAAICPLPDPISGPRSGDEQEIRPSGDRATCVALPVPPAGGPPNVVFSGGAIVNRTAPVEGVTSPRVERRPAIAVAISASVAAAATTHGTRGRRGRVTAGATTAPSFEPDATHLQVPQQVARGLPSIVRILRKARRDDAVERGRSERLQPRDRRSARRSRIAPIRLAWLFPSNAFLPVTISYSTAPNAKMSVRASASWPSSCSGAMYWNVPRIVPCAVRFGGVVGSIDRLPATAWSASLRQPEIEQLRARLRQHDVARLEIAMDDAGAVRSRERVGNLNPDLQRLVERQRTLLQPLFERLALQVLHDQEVDPVLAADVVHGADVRMTEGGERLGLALEPLLQVRVGGDVLGKDFDGDRAVQARVGRLVDLAHPARTERGGNRRMGRGGCRERSSTRDLDPPRIGEGRNRVVVGNRRDYSCADVREVGLSRWRETVITPVAETLESVASIAPAAAGQPGALNGRNRKLEL